ncbi:MAG: dUTP diphosphatase [Armatimonadetes bacterium]|nr:dUTP diphosphatase [Armatimonadota bacterium]
MEAPIGVMIRQLPHAAGLPIPRYATDGAAGLDLYAAIDQSITLNPMERRLIGTGIQIMLPPHYEAQIRPRSGLASRYGIGMVNAPGTIDSDYRGEIQVVLINWGSEPYTIHRGDRIAQMVFAPVIQVQPIVTDTLPHTTRGDGGFGSTGS